MAMAQQESQFEIDNKIDWATLLEILKVKYEANNLVIKYIDDENEEIDISTQEEFENAYALAALTNSKLRFVIKQPNGTNIDEIVMSIHKEQMDSIKPIKQEAEEKLINFDTMFNLSTMIDSRISNAAVVAEVNNYELVNNNNNNGDHIDEKNPPKWFIDGLKNLKVEIIGEIDEKLKQLYNKIEELRLEKQTNNSTYESQILTIENIQELIDQLDEAKLLNDTSKANGVENKLIELNAYDAKFIRDCNIPDGTKFEVNTRFKKSWLVQNNGRLEWPESKIRLINVAGNIYSVNTTIEIPHVNINGLVEIEVELIAPEKPGVYVSEWILAYQSYKFGPRIWCAIEVIDAKNEFNKLTLDTSLHIETHDESIQQLQSPLLPSPSAINRKLSTSTLIDEKLNELSRLSDDDDNEFVIIPDCLDLNKHWEPKQQIANLSLDNDYNFVRPTTEEYDHQPYYQQSNDNINTASTMMLVNELLLIPKRQPSKTEEEQKLTNLMTFSTSMNEDKNNNDANDSIENIKFEIKHELNDTLKEDKNLLIFSNDYSNVSFESSKQENNSPQETKFEKLIEISNTTPSAIIPSAPQMPIIQTAVAAANPEQPASLNSRYSSLDPHQQLLSMGFADRSLNNKLLNRFNNDVQQVIDHILSRQDNDWASNRH